MAEVYHFLAPFIETTKGIYISLDGEAAKNGVRKGHFKDPAVPDLWFTFLGKQEPTLIEAKIVDKGTVLVMKSQLKAWRSNGTGKHKPTSWIVVNKEFDCFYYWAHSDFLARLDATKSTQERARLCLPEKEKRTEFLHVSELSLHIIKQA